MKKTTDKRYFKRLKVNAFTIDYKVKKSGNVYSSNVINISAGGICFLRSSILSKGDLIQIKFPFQTKKIILTAEIIRIEGREVAVKFLDDDNLIEKFVEYFNIEFLGIKSKIDKLPIIEDSSENKNKKDWNNLFDDIERD